MCGRFALYSSPESVAQRLRLPASEQAWVSRYNVAPGTWITGVWHQGPGTGPAFGQLWWGYRPAWAKEGAPQPINAKVETVSTSRYFHAAFMRHRCLIPADGWFEWLVTEHGKQPYYLSRRDREPLFFQGSGPNELMVRQGVRFSQSRPVVLPRKFMTACLWR